jgi:type II secretory pathway component GspD/PulD (secretin)
MRKYFVIITLLYLLPFSVSVQGVEKVENLAKTEIIAPMPAPSTVLTADFPQAGNAIRSVAEETKQMVAQVRRPEIKTAQATGPTNIQQGATPAPSINTTGPLPQQQNNLPANSQINIPQIPLQPQPKLPGQSGAAVARDVPKTTLPLRPSGADLNSFDPLPTPLSTQGTRNKFSQGNVSLNFDDADVYSVIQTVFNEILKVNYIIDPRVKGRVTFRSIAPVPFENVLPLMEVILRLNGVAVVEENGLYRIIPISDLAREPSAINIGRNAEKVSIKGKALLQVIPIEYLQSSEVVKLVTPFISTSAVIVDMPKTNHIIIVDTDANVKRLLQMINIFDTEQQKKKGPQVFVHQVQNGKAKDIGTLLQQIFLSAKPTVTAQTGVSGAQVSAPVARPQTSQLTGVGGAEALVSDVAKIFSDEILNAIIILGTPEDYKIIKETIVKLDLVPRQVLIEGAIASIQLTDKMSLGLAWSLKTNLFGLDAVTIALNPNQLSSDTSTTSGLSLVGIDSGNQVRAVINALASNSKAKLLASPHIMVSDNREARIQVGQQVPIPTSESYGTTGGVAPVPIRTIQYKDIGIILKVKPQINDSGLVAMQISQEVSTYTKDTLYSNEVQIILNKTEASTNLVVQDGQTIVIGGLIREDDSKARQGIPFLSKIPILGYLFGNTDDENLRTELVILLTPHVIKSQKDVTSITNKLLDKMTDEQMNKEVKKGIQIKEDLTKNAGQNQEEQKSLK